MSELFTNNIGLLQHCPLLNTDFQQMVEAQKPLVTVGGLC